MTTTITRILKLIYGIALFLGVSMYAQAKVCVATASGNYNDPAIWSCGAVPSPADSVVIPTGITVTSTGNLTHNGPMLIQGTLNVNGDFGCSGNVYVYGTLNVNNTLEIYGSLHNYTGGNIHSKDMNVFGTLQNHGDIEVDEDLQVENGGEVFNYNTLKIGKNLKIEQGGSFTNDSNAYLEIFNDLKNEGILNNNTGATILICDDLKNEDNATINNTGFISICGSCPGAKYENHELENEDNASILGNGQICMCDATYNAGNTIDNQGYIDPNQLISNGTNGNCASPLAVNMRLRGVWYSADNSALLQLNLTEIPVKLVIERRLQGETEFAPVMETSSPQGLQITHKDLSLPEGFSGKILYRAYAFDAQGNKSFSNTLELRISEKNLFTVFPNPIENGQLLTIVPPSSKDKVKISLFSVNGRKIADWEKSPEFAPVKLQISNLAKGLYILNIRQAEKIARKKLIVR